MMLDELKKTRDAHECPMCGADLDEKFVCHNGDGLIDDATLEDLCERLKI